MNKTVWTFGLISGGILSAMMLLTMPFVGTIGYDRAEVIGYTTMVLAFLLIFFGVRQYRDTAGGGTIGFWRALAVGVLITVVSSVCYVATWELLYFKIAPDYATKFETLAIEKAKASGARPEVVQKKIADVQSFMKLYRNPAINAAITFLEPLPVGLVIALVSAGILGRRRRRPETSSTARAG
jgi:Protein of unknown function (DUF4199)